MLGAQPEELDGVVDRGESALAATRSALLLDQAPFHFYAAAALAAGQVMVAGRSHRDGRHQWPQLAPTTSTTIDALAVAVRYCVTVLTGRTGRKALRRIPSPQA